MSQTPIEPPKPDNPSVSPPTVITPEVLPATTPAPPVAGEVKLPHGLSRRQIVAAFVIAGLSDAISVFATWAPPVEWTVDIITAAALFAVLGWRWLLLPGLVMEAVPGLAIVPVWVLVVSAIAVWGSARPKLN